MAISVYINEHIITDTPMEDLVTIFITNTMSKALENSKYDPNFNFLFLQPEAIRYVREILDKYVSKYPHSWDKAYKIEGMLNRTYNDYIDETPLSEQELQDGNELPKTLVISDYKLFFGLLRQYWEGYKKLYLSQIEALDVTPSEATVISCFDYLWLRATPEDFHHPEMFLSEQVQFVNDKTFSKYNGRTLIGASPAFDDHLFCVKNDVSAAYDETPQHFQVTLHDKRFYNTSDPRKEEQYILPVIRYGIYEKNGKRICHIGAIQSQDNVKDLDIVELFNLKRSKVNKGVFAAENQEYQDYVRESSRMKQNNETYIGTAYHPENISEVEPAHLIALTIFINFLHQEGITEIEVPSIYSLDYEYHEKEANTEILISEHMTKEEKIGNPIKYFEQQQKIEKLRSKPMQVSCGKSEQFIRTFRRLAYHYPNSQIKAYPNDFDSYLHLSVPVVRSEDDLNGELVKEIYSLVNQFYRSNKKR